MVFRAFTKEAREARSTRLALIALGVVTCTLGHRLRRQLAALLPAARPGDGRDRTGAVARQGRRRPDRCSRASTAAVRDGWGAVNVAYGTFLSTMVTAAILSLSEAVRELRAAREELARRAVEEERLRFSRDLHDLLGHTLSVIVVKSEAARRLAHRDLDAALVQVGDIESVGRQALTEIREAVTGYREGSLATELDRARSALQAAGIEPVVRQSGPPLAAQTEALLGWVVREAVTNAVRHSGATRCEIAVEVAAERVRVRVSDDGRGQSAEPAGPPPPGLGTGGMGAIGGTGLKGLTERLAAAGGSLEAGPGPRGGFVVTAELPVETAELGEEGPRRTSRRGRAC